MSADLADLVPEANALPDGWSLHRLGDVARLGGGTTPARGEARYWDGATIPWATPSDITSLALGVTIIGGTESMVTERALAECSLPLNVPGTVLMTSRATIGFAAINTVPMTTNQGFISFNTGPDLDPEFLLHWLIAQRPNLVAAAGGSTFKELSRGTAKLLPILLPHIDEQRRIAEVLRSADEAIARCKDAAEQAGRVIDGMLQKLFVEGIGHSDFKEGYSTLIPTSWEEKPLGDLAASPITYGVVQPGPNVAAGVPFIRGGDFPNGKIDIGALRKISHDVAAQYRRTQLKGGEIVVSLVGYPGACAIVPDSLAGANIARQAALIRPATEIVASYLYQFLRSPIGQARLKKETIGSAQQVINLRDLKEVIVAVPSRHEQVQIASILADLDAFVELERENLAMLTKLKGTIAADLLAGRVRVPAPVISATRSVPTAFKRAVFAAEIVHQLHNDNRFGSVKHEKIVHLCELHLGLQDDLDRRAYKEAAGPYDPKARRSVERIFQQQKWFDATKPDGNRVVYVPLEKAGGHAEYFDRYFGDQRPAIQSIIDLMRPLDTHQCEIVATLYAVWNDFLIDGRQPTDDEIVASVLQWHPKKQEIGEDRWRRALPWMRLQGLTPKGTGEKTRVAQA